MTIRRRRTITMMADWRAALLTERRWALLTALQGQGAMAVRELVRRGGRDVKRVHEDVQVLTELGLVERDDAGGVLCPFADVHIDMHVHHENVAA